MKKGNYYETDIEFTQDELEYFDKLSKEELVEMIRVREIDQRTKKIIIITFTQPSSILILQTTYFVQVKVK